MDSLHNIFIRAAAAASHVLSASLSVAVSLVLAVSCGKSGGGPEQEPSSGRVPVRIAMSLTRVIDDSFETGDKVGLFIVNQPGTLKVSGNHADNACHTFDGSGWSSSSTIYWVDDETKADFYCYCPYSGTVSSVEAFPFSVREDQRDQSAFKASDFLWGRTTGVSPIPDPVNITMSHRMSILAVRLKAGDGWTDDELKSADVTLCGLKTSALVNLSDGTVTADGAAGEMKPLAEGGGSFKALVVPQAVKSAELVRIRVGGESYVFKTSINLTSGMTHTSTITLKRTAGGVRIGINPWETDDKDYGGTVE